MDFLSKFQGGFKRVSSMFQGCFQSVSKVCQGSFEKMLKCFKEVSCCMSLIAATRAEGGLVSKHKSFSGVSRVFKGCFKFKGSFKDVLRKF